MPRSGRASRPRPASRRSARVLTLAAGTRRVPPPTPTEVARLAAGGRTRGTRDAAAISHHYDVSDDFYRAILGPSMTY